MIRNNYLVLQAVPNLCGGEDLFHPVDLEKVQLQLSLEECAFKDFPCDQDLLSFCVDLMSEFIK